MKITKIEKKKRLYLLEIDETDKLYITEDTIVRFMLSKGMTITEEELKAIQEFAQISYGKNLALYYLSFKLRTESEVKDYLIKHDIESNFIPTILKQLKDENWINDSYYAQTAIQQNLSSGDKGPYVLRQKLLKKGIADSIITEELTKADFSDLIIKVSQKIAKTYQKKLPTKALKDKILQGLINKGFNFQDAKVALAQLTIEKDEEQEEELIYKELEKQHRKYSRKYEGYELKQRLIQALMRKGYDYSDIDSALREFL